jgi:hypothetical protein
VSGKLNFQGTIARGVVDISGLNLSASSTRRTTSGPQKWTATKQ